MTTKDLKLPAYIYIDDKGRVVCINTELMSMYVELRKDGKHDRTIFADIVDRADRIGWKTQKSYDLSPKDKAILREVLRKFQQDPSFREHNEQMTLKRFEYLMNVEHQELDDYQKKYYELLKQ